MTTFPPRPVPRDPRLFILDLDGTLIDSRPQILAGARAVLARFGKPEIPVGILREYVAFGVQPLFRVAFGDGEPHRQAMAEYVRHYSAHGVHETVPYPGLQETLRALSFARLAVLTNKPSAVLRAILRHLGIESNFRVALGSEDVPEPKPSPSGVEMILWKLGVKPEEAVVVGDTGTDCLAGRAAGTYAVGCAYGFRPRWELEESGADLIVDRLADLVDHFGVRGCPA